MIDKGPVLKSFEFQKQTHTLAAKVECTITVKRVDSPSLRQQPLEAFPGSSVNPLSQSMHIFPSRSKLEENKSSFTFPANDENPMYSTHYDMMSNSRVEVDPEISKLKDACELKDAKIAI